ncbi:MAG: hypothetical protein SGARI_007603, partial [Bacillariaceae sp.]
MKSISKAASATVVAMALTSNAFVHQQVQHTAPRTATTSLDMWPFQQEGNSSDDMPRKVASLAAAAALAASLALNPMAAFAENELSDKYGGKGFDSSLVDQTCLVDKCSLQAKACLADDPSCRKGLTCTAKCLGDNACITGCMAR